MKNEKNSNLPIPHAAKVHCTPRPENYFRRDGSVIDDVSTLALLVVMHAATVAARSDLLVQC